MNKLNRFYLSQNISIDNALSMNQILHQIVNHIKEIVDFINNLELRANEYTDEQIRILNDQLQEQLTTLEQTLKTYTDDSIGTYDAEVINPQLTTIRNTIDTLRRTLNERIDNEVGILNRRIDSEVSTLNRIIEDTKTYLEDLIKKGMAYVYSSISGRHLPLQNVLGEIGNALKQILSYNWNTINLLKTVEVSPVGYTDIDSGEYKYKKVNVTYQISNVSINGDNLIVGSPISSPTNIIVNGVEVQTSVLPSFTIPLSLFTQYLNTITLVKDATTEWVLEIINTNYDAPSSKITFNSLKSQMQNTDIEIRPNWNGLVFDGVNGWNILASVGGLYDDETVVNPLWNELPYKNTVYRNENSPFYNQIENEENGGE